MGQGQGVVYLHFGADPLAADTDHAVGRDHITLMVIILWRRRWSGSISARHPVWSGGHAKHLKNEWREGRRARREAVSSIARLIYL